MQTSKYRAVQNGTRVGLIFISKNPNNADEKVATIIPIHRQGSWCQNDLALDFSAPVHEFFPESVSDEEIRDRITERAGFTLSTLSFQSLPL